MENLSSSYDPKQVEQKIYQLWEKSGYFNPDKLPIKKSAKSYTIVMPPPNVTGSLHMGHALNGIIQDILIRLKRMQQFRTLWLPGTDHAGIATQNVVEKELKKQNLTRHDLGRKKFLEKVWQWKEKYGDIILEQFKKLGCSCDWSRTRFTMDADYSKAVQAAFLRLYKKNWIYQGDRVINWCPRCSTSLSDLELEFAEEKSFLWFIKYPLKNNAEKFIIVATTRPETMLGDTAVAVNPKDKRYKDFIGETVVLPIQNREIPIIADPVIDPKFGTGVLKVTPAHDLTDFEMGRRHNLENIKVIGENGKMTGPIPQSYQGLKTIEARQKIVDDLKNLNFLEKIDDYTHQIPHCYRCNSIIEPLISKQWFIKIEHLAELAITAHKKKLIEFIPQRWEKIYLDWLKNIKDWCISRQIWWGHKIPLEGVDDVLDTWFSSALWPFATLGWPLDSAPPRRGSARGKPKQTNDFEKFYPTQTLITARDIINLWVGRMIFSGLEFTNKAPFKNIYVHPTILTKEGKRMSKSLGTGVDPLGLIEKYGADAVRFGLIYQVLGNQDMRFNEESLVAGRKFCNKIWNASRFVMGQIGNSKSKILNSKQIPNSKFQKSQNLTPADKRILKRLNEIIKSVTADLKNFKFGQPAHLIYNFFWHDFCDKYIEQSKSEIRNPKSETKKVLLYVLLNSLKLLHPFMPFITEEIYQKLLASLRSPRFRVGAGGRSGPLKDKKLLIVENWPH